MVNFRGFGHSDLISARLSQVAYGTTVFKVPAHVEEESNRFAWRSELLTELRDDVTV